MPNNIKTILQDLEYASSLNKEQRGDGILRWASDHSDDDLATLPPKKQKKLSELLFRSIEFLKLDRSLIKKSIINLENIKKFL
jgi:hypothetical protein